MMERYNVGYIEAYSILNSMSEKMKSKIPKKVWENIKFYKDREVVNSKIKSDFYMHDEIISMEANKILAVIYKKYFATNEEKILIKNKENIIANKKRIIWMKEEEQKRKKYNPDSIFIKKNISQ